MIQRDDDSGTARWIYDTAPNGMGKLAAMVSPSDARLKGTCNIEFAPPPMGGENQAGRSFHYTAFGDVEEVTDCADGSAFVTTYGYDQFGRPNLLRYPAVKGNRFAVDYVYTQAGYLRYVADDADGKVLWAVKAMNAAGQVTDEQLRNGVETVSVRNDATGWLLGRTSTAHGDGETAIQRWGLAFDEVGNLRGRQRTDDVNAANSSETFIYDSTDRLTSSEVQIPSQSYDAVDIYAFDALGNLQTKVGKTYKYGTGCMAGGRAAGPHALCQIDNGPTYNYDGNGNLLSVGDRAAKWNAANKTTRLTSGTGTAMQTADYIYGADGQRVVQVIGTGDGELGSTSNSTVSRTVYVGLGATGKSVYERTTRGNTVEHAHFIYAGAAHDGGAFAIRVVTEDTSSSSSTPTTAYQYHHFDHLGSLTAVSDGNGHVTSAAWGGPAAGILGYDPWGARRSPDGRAADAATFSSPTGNRGFTDQETIPGLGLVNMNGRIYDPVVGRFLSADPNIQVATDLQSYNRYSYAAGNPLRYTDPTGYFWAPGFDSFVNITIGVAGVAACWGSGIGCGVAFGLVATAYNTSSAIASGVPWDEAIGPNLLGFAAGFQFGMLGGAIGGAIGGSEFPRLGAILGGAIGGGAAAAFMTPHSGGDLGENILASAAQGALFAALSVAAHPTNAVSEAAAAEGGDGQHRRALISYSDIGKRAVGFDRGAYEKMIAVEGRAEFGIPDDVEIVVRYTPTKADVVAALKETGWDTKVFFMHETGLRVAGNRNITPQISPTRDFKDGLTGQQMRDNLSSDTKTLVLAACRTQGLANDVVGAYTDSMNPAAKIPAVYGTTGWIHDDLNTPGRVNIWTDQQKTWTAPLPGATVNLSRGTSF